MTLFSSSLLPSFIHPPSLPFLFSLLLVLLPLPLPTHAFNLSIRPTGSQFTRTLGKSMLLTCEAVGVEERDAGRIRLRWTHGRDNKEVVVAHGRMYVEGDGPAVKKLYVTSLEEEDAGSYTCQGSLDGHTQTKTVTLDLLKAITFDEAPNPQNPIIHTDALVKCRVSGFPPPTVSWRYDGRKVGQGGRYHITKEGLKIFNVTEADNGVYQCRAEVESDGRYDDRRISVFVYIPPRVTVQPGHVVGLEGSPASLTCQALGLPVPQYTFLKDGKRLIGGSGGSSSGRSSGRVKVNETIGRIDFYSLIKDEDEGRYQCNASNAVGSVVVIGQLTVNVIPSITTFNNVTTITEGTSSHITCISRAHPPARMELFRARDPGSSTPADEYDEDGNSVDERVSFRRDVARGLIEMTIQRAKIQDAGNYVCTASNAVGSDQRTATVVVYYAPRFIPLSSGAPVTVARVHAWARVSRNLTCRADANPAPLFTWYRRDAVITSNSTYHVYNVISEGNVHVTSLEVRVGESDVGYIFGLYTCKAVNKVGDKSLNVELLLATVPAPPKSLVVGHVLPDRVDLSVTPSSNNGGLPITGYSVEISGGGGGGGGGGETGGGGASVGGGSQDFSDVTLEFSINNTMTSSVVELLIEDLQPGTSYVLRVRARNDVGLSVTPSKSVTVMTQPAQIPGRIDRGSAVFSSVQSDRFTLTWFRPSTGGLPLTQYTLRWRPVEQITSGTEVLYQPTMTSRWSSRTLRSGVLLTSRQVTETVDKLLPDSWYQVEVTSSNSLGTSEPSQPPLYTQTTGGAGDTLSVPAVRSAAALDITLVLTAVAASLLLVFVVIIDITCYHVNDCGITRCLCVRVCGRSTPVHKGCQDEEKGDEEEKSKLGYIEVKDSGGRGRGIDPPSSPSTAHPHTALNNHEGSHVTMATNRAQEQEQQQEEIVGTLAAERDKLLGEEGEGERGREGEGRSCDDLVTNTPPAHPVPAPRRSLAAGGGGTGSGAAGGGGGIGGGGVNRKSILSQGDERWRFVVKELERELGVQKPEEGDERGEGEGGGEEGVGHVPLRPVIKLTDPVYGGLRRPLSHPGGGGDVGGGAGPGSPPASENKTCDVREHLGSYPTPS